jgi:hypothetical protein
MRKIWLQHAEDLGVLFRDPVADRVRDVDRRCARVDGRLHHLAEILQVRARSVLGRELDVLGVALRAPHGGDGHLQHLFPRPSQLVLEVDIRGRHEGMDAPLRGTLDRLAGRVDVFRLCPRQRRDRRPLHLSAAIVGPCTSQAIWRTEAKSPGDEIGNPASMISTLSRAS